MAAVILVPHIPTIRCARFALLEYRRKSSLFPAYCKMFRQVNLVDSAFMIRSSRVCIVQSIYCMAILCENQARLGFRRHDAPR